MIWAVIGLIVSNAATLVWALKTRAPASKEVRALRRAIMSFEKDGETILKIERINPESIFLRNPQR